MDSFTKMGETMLLVAEGQKEIGRALIGALGRGFARLRTRVRRGMADISHSPR
jgi:hypothetical protein